RPCRYRYILTYENLALEAKIRSWRVNGPYGRLLIGYPGITMWADHPVVALREPATSDEEKAISKWLEFLRGEAMQKQVLEYGFRPGNKEYRRYLDAAVNHPKSLLYRVPTERELAILLPPDGDVITEMMLFWHSLQGGQTIIDVSESGRLKR
ncbi:MAG: hypothetical protein AAGC55_22795, partial [Myxococcota bacterium]